METAATRLDILAQLNWFDVGVCAVLVISLVIGLIRGFFSQVAGIVGVIAALLLALELSPRVYEFGLGHFPGLTTTTGMIGAFTVVFLATWVLWLALTHFGKRLLSRMEFGAFDRLLGGVFGLAKGALLAYVLLILMHRFTPNDWSVSHEFAASRVNQGVEFVDAILKQQQENIPRAAWAVIAELRGFGSEGPEAHSRQPIRFRVD